MTYDTWCDRETEDVGTHKLRVLTGRAGDLAHGQNTLAAAVPSHYAAEEQVSRILQRLGKAKAAKFIEGKLPTTKLIRSGDLGEPCEVTM